MTEERHPDGAPGCVVGRRVRAASAGGRDGTAHRTTDRTTDGTTPSAMDDRDAPASSGPARSRRRIRSTRGARLVRVAAGAAILVAVLVGYAPFGSGTRPAAAADVTRTAWGPLTDTDRDFLVKVRQAGLWEIPTGLQAQDRAASQVVKDVGLHLAADHRKLDQQVRTVAGQLGVQLPDQPSAAQQSWMAELSTLSGPAYDSHFANRLRAAHGTVFQVVAQIRSTSQNSMIRAFAQVAVNVVMRHMTLLEGTSMIDQQRGLFVPPTAALKPSRSGMLSTPVIVVAVVAFALANAALAVRRSRE